MIHPKFQLKHLKYIVLASAFLVTLATLIWLLIYSRYGIDLTDESHYLIWMANPWFYSYSVSQFGFIYHPLHWLVQGDITRLRQANILIIFSLAWILCVVFFRATLSSWRSLPTLVLAGITATSAFIYFCPYGWLATPSYNSLVFQALMMTSIGLLLAEKTNSRISIAGWLLISIGGWLVFMAKPSSAAALVLVIGIFLPLMGKFNSRLMIVSTLTTMMLLIISAWLIDDSIANFIDRLKNGIEAVRLLDAGQFDLFRIDALIMDTREWTFIALFSTFTLVALYCGISDKKTFIFIGIGLNFLLIISSLAIISGHIYWQIPVIRKLYLLPPMMLAIPLIGLIFSLIRSAKIKPIQWKIAVYFLLLPYVAAFGTNNNNWVQGSLDSLFWLLAGLTILMPATANSERVLLPISIGGQLLSILLLQNAMKYPYMQPQPLWQNDIIVTIGANESQLVLPQDLADYYRDIQKIAPPVGTPILDITGVGSGTLYAMQAKAIGYPWLVGGFAGSENMAIALLNRVSCTDIAAAWLLIDTDKQRWSLSPNLLHRLGFDLAQDFELAQELATSPTTLTHHGIPAQRRQLWKPAHTAKNRIATCEQKRNNQSQ